MRNSATHPLSLPRKSGELNEYVSIFQELNTLSLPKNETLEKWFLLLNWNYKNFFFAYQKLQKLWMKLIKKYKFKLVEWEALSNSCNIHSLLLDENGHGLQNLMRKKKKR